MTRGELLGRISSAELTLWAVEFQIRAWERENEQPAPPGIFGA